MAKASIIIPTYNSARTLDECLKSSLSNNSKYPFEVIVVDKGSTDETLSIAQKHGVKYFIEPGSLRGKARNVGIKQASGDIVCFTDSDCVAPPDWIDQLVDNLLKLNKEE